MRDSENLHRKRAFVVIPRIFVYGSEEQTSGPARCHHLLNGSGTRRTVANEKWLLGTGQQWYFILPNGELRKWAGTMTASMTAANLVTGLDPSYYANPSLLWNAQPGTTPNVKLGISGNQLTVQPPTGYTGSFVVQVVASAPSVK